LLENNIAIAFGYNDRTGEAWPLCHCDGKTYAYLIALKYSSNEVAKQHCCLSQSHFVPKKNASTGGTAAW
jgi:hypothetical protein